MSKAYSYTLNLATVFCQTAYSSDTGKPDMLTSQRPMVYNSLPHNDIWTIEAPRPQYTVVARFYCLCSPKEFGHMVWLEA